MAQVQPGQGYATTMPVDPTKPQPGPDYPAATPPAAALPPAPPGVAPPAPPAAAMPGPPPGAQYPTQLPPAMSQPAMPGAPKANVRTGVAEIAQAGPADYAGVQGFADQAYEQARRNIDPQQDQARRRMEQDLINKGIDPTSAQGMGMLDQQSRNFTDQDQAANFGALQFGQGIQQQMFGQAFQNTSAQNAMTQANMQADIARGQMANQRYGIDVGAQTTRYGMDQNYGIQKGQLGLSQQNQDFNQMMGLEGVDFRNRAYNDKQNQYYDQLTMAMMGVPIPGYGGYDPSALAGQMYGSSGGGGFFG